MRKRVYDTNNDGIVDVARFSLYGPSNAQVAGYASNAEWALWSFSNSNSLYADTAGNAIFFDGNFSGYYTNLSNMYGYLLANQSQYKITIRL